METSSAIVENNRISDNLKANIALGGLGSQNTLICNNTITEGRCEGIFMLDACECMIVRNTITLNNEGIVAITSIPHLQNNKIFRNKNNGTF